jgi:hypothetical protein
MTVASAAPVRPTDPYSAGFALSAPPTSETSALIVDAAALRKPAPADTLELSAEFLTIGSASGWFDTAGVEPGISDDSFEPKIDAGSCIYPDSYFRSLAAGEKDCRVLRPGGDDSEIFTLPFVAVSAWTLVILAGAGSYHVHRTWRARRWLQHLRGQGLAPHTTSRPDHSMRRSRQPRSRARSRRRSRAG